MIKVSRLIDTIGTEKFKNHLQTNFSFEFLTGENPYFDNWRVKNMGSWLKFINDDEIVLEVYPNTYKIKKPKETNIYEIPIPKNINEFIEDMHRFNVNIYWKSIIDELFEPKDYLNINDIRNYYVQLLTKINKSFELI